MHGKRYWVVGGRYETTEFKTIAGGGPEERYGPFVSHADAVREWQSHAWATVDACNVRYRIIEEDDGQRDAA